MPDQIMIEILEDGTISYRTDKISGVNHASADEFLAELEKALGGKIVRRQTPHKHQHQHERGKAHAY